MSAVKDMTLRPVAELEATAPAANTLTVFERLARDPLVDVDKLERLMQMHERATARSAEEQFNAAMTAAQAEMRPIAADAYNPQTRSKYASYAALDTALRPVYTKHGFGLSFDTGEAPPQYVRVLCYVTHNGGHSRTYKADMPADGKGAKGGDVMTLTHAFGAGTAYGMRYLLKMIFNVAVGEADDDGNGASARTTAPEPPKGYQDWLNDLRDCADEGFDAAKAAWKQSAQPFRDYLEKHAKGELESLKAKGRAADAKKEQS